MNPIIFSLYTAAAIYLFGALVMPMMLIGFCSVKSDRTVWVAGQFLGLILAAMTLTASPFALFLFWLQNV